MGFIFWWQSENLTHIIIVLQTILHNIIEYLPIAQVRGFEPLSHPFGEGLSHQMSTCIKAYLEEIISFHKDNFKPLYFQLRWYMGFEPMPFSSTNWCSKPLS